MLRAPCTELQGAKHLRSNKGGGAEACKGEEKSITKSQSRMVLWKLQEKSIEEDLIVGIAAKRKRKIGLEKRSLDLTYILKLYCCFLCVGVHSHLYF